MRYAFVERERPNYTVALLCRVMEVSLSGFYASVGGSAPALLGLLWRRRPKRARAQQDKVLSEKTWTIHTQSRSNYGAPRVHAELRDQQVRCGKKRVARFMRLAGLKGRSKGAPKPTRSQASLPSSNNLLKGNFGAARPDAVWVSDITYLRTQEGWLYLAVVLDLFSRRVVGRAMQARITTALTLAAPDMACRRRKSLPGLIHHLDRGGQYVSGDYQNALRAAGMLASTSGNCLENAVAENFFATLKTEEVQDYPYETRAQARRCVFDYLEVFYNRQRRHSSLGFQSPAAFEAAATLNQVSSKAG